MSRVGAVWGLAGVILLLASAIYRLTPIAIDAFTHAWLWYHWAAFVGMLFFMAYVEGYRAFQRAFSPRVAARARYILKHPNWIHTLFAPFFCMAYFHTSRRRQITSLSVTAGIVVLVILVRLLDQPWRGIIDGGVVVGLAWGLISLVVFAYRALIGDESICSPEVPGETL